MIRLLLLALLFPALAAAQSPIEQMQQSTVRVFCESPTGFSTGSGFVVEARHVATNHHVIDCVSEGGRALVAISQYDMRPAQVIWQTEDDDLALLRLDSALARPVVRLIPDSLITPNDDVRAIGYPAAADFRTRRELTPEMFVPSVTRGIVSRLLDIQSMPLVQTDAPISPGNSGGPLFSTCGDVLGINTMVATTDGGVQAQGIGYAVRASRLLSGMQEMNLTIAVTTARCEGTTPPPGTEASLPAPPADSTAVQAEEPEASLFSWLLFGVLFLVAAGVTLFRVFTSRAGEQSGARSRAQGGASRSTSAAAVEPITPVSTDWPALVGIDGALAGHRLPLASGERLRIGRDGRYCTLVFPESAKEISKQHVEVRWDTASRTMHVKDLDSLNGTFDARGQRFAPGEERSFKPGEAFYLAHPRHRFAVPIR